MRELLAKGWSAKPRLLALQRSQAQIDGCVARGQAGIARARQVIAETRQQMRSLAASRRSRSPRSSARRARAAPPLEEQLRATADRLARTMITAPVAGTVVDLQVKTPGGVVDAGKPLLDIVPAAPSSLLEARVAPTDIDEVHAGLWRRSICWPTRAATCRGSRARVREVSADRLEDATTHQPYYLARVAVGPDRCRPASCCRRHAGRRG